MSKPPGYSIRLDTVCKGFDGRTCWVHARAGAIPGRVPVVVLTMQKLLLSGSDVFYALNEMRTDDLGEGWSGPHEHAQTLGRRQEAGGVVVCVCDFTPGWHAKTGVLLGTGHTARYRGDALLEDPRPRETAYSIYDAAARTWSAWETVRMPDAARFFSSGAGSTQRVDLHFEKPRPWTFDDGAEFGSYNTQQHWVTHSGALFLVYTRRGADNDHVFRHRAPLFMAEVDADRLCVVRDSERILVPQRGARLGNFGVVNVSRGETWVTVTEWMQPVGCEKHGSDNSVYAARILWDEPNEPAISG